MVRLPFLERMILLHSDSQKSFDGIIIIRSWMVLAHDTEFIFQSFSPRNKHPQGNTNAESSLRMKTNGQDYFRGGDVILFCTVRKRRSSFTCMVRNHNTNPHQYEYWRHHSPTTKKQSNMNTSRHLIVGLVVSVCKRENRVSLPEITECSGDLNSLGRPKEGFPYVLRV